MYSRVVERPTMGTIYASLLGREEASEDVLTDGHAMLDVIYIRQATTRYMGYATATI